jgi:hypothetical protein
MHADSLRVMRAASRTIALVATVATACHCVPGVAVAQSAPARGTPAGRSVRGALSALDAAARERQARRDATSYDPMFLK